MISADDIEAMKPKRWILLPGPGQMRGEGKWFDFDECARKEGASEFDTNGAWNIYQETKFLPTCMQEEKPADPLPAKCHSLD